MEDRYRGFLKAQGQGWLIKIYKWQPSLISSQVFLIEDEAVMNIEMWWRTVSVGFIAARKNNAEEYPDA